MLQCHANKKLQSIVYRSHSMHMQGHYSCICAPYNPLTVAVRAPPRLCHVDFTVPKGKVKNASPLVSCPASSLYSCNPSPPPPPPPPMPADSGESRRRVAHQTPPVSPLHPPIRPNPSREVFRARSRPSAVARVSTQRPLRRRRGSGGLRRLISVPFVAPPRGSASWTVLPRPMAMTCTRCIGPCLLCTGEFIPPSFLLSTSLEL